MHSVCRNVAAIRDRGVYAKPLNHRSGVLAPPYKFHAPCPVLPRFPFGARPASALRFFCSVFLEGTHGLAGRTERNPMKLLVYDGLCQMRYAERQYQAK